MTQSGGTIVSSQRARDPNGKLLVGVYLITVDLSAAAEPLPANPNDYPVLLTIKSTRSQPDGETGLLVATYAMEAYDPGAFELTLRITIREAAGETNNSDFTIVVLEP
ncbi:MAG: hypothetical protein IH986_00105 [Planctomycetes bacterium]|nr:hypothetical protein [Planctomycetota bacterium]